jgi:hypothetical protein
MSDKPPFRFLHYCGEVNSNIMQIKNQWAIQTNRCPQYTHNAQTIYKNTIMIVKVIGMKNFGQFLR